MIIVADDAIPFAEPAFGQFGEVRLLPGRSMSRESLRDADVLFVRSVTRVDAALLNGTSVRFVGSATSGIDHVDVAFLRSVSIPFASAAGSNARAVAEYVAAALLELHALGLLPITESSIGVVGAGAIGSIVARFARAMGMLVIEYDPPRELLDPSFQSARFDQLLDCDVISLHVPLTHQGSHRTHEMVDASVLARMTRGQILINTSRGCVVHSAALVEYLQRTHAPCVLDVWEGEPSIPIELLSHATICTPHIAGYSLDGKVGGTVALMRSLAQWCQRDESTLDFSYLPQVRCIVDAQTAQAGCPTIRSAVVAACDIARDNREMRGLLKLDEVDRRAEFDRLRRTYRVRREFTSFAIMANDPRDRAILEHLGFAIAERSDVKPLVD